MSGRLRALLDTNAIVSLLAGNHELAARLEQAEYVGISIVSYLEFLAFDGLTDGDRACFNTFCARVQIEPLTLADQPLLQQTLELRSRYRLKLPDAAIAATAFVRDAQLISNDSHFTGIPTLKVQAC